MKKVLYSFLMLLSIPCFSTQQIPEQLNIIGAVFDIPEYPMKSHPKYKTLLGKLDRGECSASHRGFQAEWIIYNGKLCLGMLLMNPCSDAAEPFELQSFFNFDLKNEVVFADWYSGKITYQIGPDQASDQSEEIFEGVRYEAVVYKINKGLVESRNIEVIKEVRNE